MPASIAVRSPAFAADAAIAVDRTAERAGRSPPLAWSGVPAGAAALCRLIEDADAPSLSPLVHGIVYDLPPGDGALAQGELKRPSHPGTPHRLGKNSFMKAEYLPPDPPGHGPHRYYFPMIALDRRPELFSGTADQSEAVRWIADHAVAEGLLIGAYAR
jgi:phosphatidylethanolamine-binding protein (PEBP) family uncharacterized protein